MSAYIVDKHVIDTILTMKLALDAQDGDPGSCVIVDALLERGVFGAQLVLDHDTFGNVEVAYAKLGSLLWDENARSVRYRYPADAIEYAPYRWAPVFYSDIGELTERTIKMIGEWEYQTCEHPTHTASEAWHFVQDMRSELFDRFDLDPSIPSWKSSRSTAFKLMILRARTADERARLYNAVALEEIAKRAEYRSRGDL